MMAQARMMDRNKHPISLGAFAAALFTGVVVLRLWLGRGLPLWLDETWTGMIATQPGWAAFWREVWLDCNPPLYYALMALWTGIAGASDMALRSPSLVFMTAAALLPLCWRLPGLSRGAALGWALLLCLWQPGMEIAVDARGYALLYLLSVGQAMAFISLMAAPTQTRAWVWAALASLAGLTHYHALLLGGLQGLALLWLHRKAALRLWPAAFAFLPAFGWLGFHAPRLAEYARPDIAWYEPMTPALAGGFVRYALGSTSWAHAAVLIAILLTARFWPGASRGRQAGAGGMAAPKWLVAISLLALGVELFLGSLRPMLTDRYLVPLVPGLLFGLVLAVQHSRAAGLAIAALVVSFLAPLDPAALRERLVQKTSYQFETASLFIQNQGPRRLVFTWDHPASAILDRGSLARLGGFFLTRAGVRLPVDPVVLKPREDGNQRLAKAAGRDGAVVWIYNRARASAARAHPPHRAQWQGRACRWTYGAWVGTLACGPLRAQGGIDPLFGSGLPNRASRLNWAHEQP